MSLSDIAADYERRLRAAKRRDDIAIAARLIVEREDLWRSNLAGELRDIGRDLRSVKSPDTTKPLNETERQTVSEDVARRLGLPEPEHFGTVLGEASVENFLNILIDIEEILQRVK